MRIAFFTDTYYPQINGVTISVDNFAKELRRKGHTVYIFAPKMNEYKDTDPDVVRLSSVKILSSNPEIRFPFFFPHKIVSQILPVKFDIVHAHGNGPFSFLGYQVARMKDVPYVLTFHTQFTKYTHYIFHGKVVKPRMVAAGLRVFANICDGIITPSEKMKKELEKYGVKKSISVIPNFVTVTKFQHLKKNYLHKKYMIPDDSPILLSVGRLGKEKNFVFVIKMFKKLADKEKKPHLVIVGEGTERKNLERIIQSLALEGRVHLTGKIDNQTMPHVYADADIFVFASKTEVHPMVVLEAASSGLPLVVARDGAFTGIVQDKVNGYLLPLQQKMFVATIKHLLKDPLLLHRLGENSRKIAYEHFDAEIVTVSLINFYKEVLEQYNPTLKRFLKLNKAAFLRIQRTTESIERFFSS